MYKLLLPVVFTFLLLPAALAQNPADLPQTHRPAGHSHGARLGRIAALRDLPATPPPAGRRAEPGEAYEHENLFPRNELANPAPLPAGGRDPLLAPAAQSAAASRPSVIVPGVNFEGLRDEFVLPPDPTGDVGKNHYVQAVNSGYDGSWLQIWNKQGASVVGPISTDTIWAQVDASSGGDPIVQYDHAAGRWLLLELEGTFANELLLAISDTDDPTGGWTAYRFNTLGFPDYPKLYVWPDAYVVTVNEIVERNECSGYALERAALLDGANEFDLYRFSMPTYNGIRYQPATGVDWEAGPAPPAGTPGLVVRVYDDAWDGGADHLELWELHVDWQDTAATELVGPVILPVTPFETTVCWGWFDCIEQPEPWRARITALEQIVMYRAPYRNFGSYESIVLNHVSDASGSVGPGGDAALRWYELRRAPGGPWMVHQEGAFAPDADNRFMGTVSQDGAGNIALGYSVASTQTYPGLRLNARRPGDAPGQLPATEHVLVDGAQSHKSVRWGDYSALAVDPEDDRTFWFTGEYQPADASWGTRIGSFTVRRDSIDVAPVALLAPTASAGLGAAEPVSVAVHNYGFVPASNIALTLQLDGQTAANAVFSGPLPPGSSALVTFPGTFNFSEIAKFYSVEIFTTILNDQFPANDTLTVTLQNRPVRDAAVVGTIGLTQPVCGREHAFGLIWRNDGAAAISALGIQCLLDGQPASVAAWSGSLPPGALDTVYFELSDLPAGVHDLTFELVNPNGLPDQRPQSDTLSAMLTVNPLGSPGLLAFEPQGSGVLYWQVLGSDGSERASGIYYGRRDGERALCLDDDACYRLVLASPSGFWFGTVRLYDIYGHLTVEKTSGVWQLDTTAFCTPNRVPRDVGAFQLVDPVTGPDLTASNPVTVAVRNYGLTPVANIAVAYRRDSTVWHVETSADTLYPGQTRLHTFAATEDLSAVWQSWHFDAFATVPGDQLKGNDTLRVAVRHLPAYEVEILSVNADAVCSDPDGAQLHLELRNNGARPVESVRLAYTVDGDSFVEEQSFFAPQKTGEEFNVYFVPDSLHEGSNAFTYRIGRINETGIDYDPSNDTGSLTLAIDSLRYLVSVQLLFDAKPEHTSWALYTVGGTLVDTMGGYTEPYGYELRQHCLERDTCYVLRLYDGPADGFFGSVTVYAGGYTLLNFEGGTFAVQELPFCAKDPCDTFQLALAVVPPSVPGASDGTITATASGGEPPYRYSRNDIVYTTDSVFGGLGEGTHTVFAREAGGCRTQRTVKLEALSGVGEAPAKKPAALAIRPNPASDIVHISVPAVGAERMVMGAVYDAMGRRVQLVRLTRWDGVLHGMLDVRDLRAGVYFIRIENGVAGNRGRLVKVE